MMKTIHLVVDGLTVKLAEKLTKFLVKKRIVGKSISDRMRAIYGAVDPHDKSHESTWCFGTSSTGINISAVMSQSETDEMHLGDYAGQGIGGSSSRTFSVDGNDADMYIVTIMSAMWASDYTITFELGDGEWIQDYEVPSMYTYGDVVQLPTSENIVEREGYVFAGWYLKEDTNK